MSIRYQAISVCIPIYNIEPRLLKETLQSVLIQKGDFSIEIILSDDQSSINYSNVLRSFPKRNIKYFKNEANLGMVANWNRAVGLSKGEFVLLLGQDDVLLPDMFNDYLKVFNTNPGVVLCSSGRQFINENGEFLKLKRGVNDRSKIYKRKKLYLLSSKDATRLSLRNGNAIGEPSSVMYRREAYKKVFGYDSAFFHAADLDFNLKMSKIGQIAYINYPYLLRRIHGANLTDYNFASGIITHDRIKIYQKHVCSHQFSSKEIIGFKAYLVAGFVLDIIRGIKKHHLKVAVCAFIKIFEYLDFAPLIYMSYLKEILTAKNKDMF